MPKIVRAEGKTASERYLKKLAEHSFLDLWSYPNVFVDRRSNGHRSDGKELCDLLIVCGDHVIVFSDKSISWPELDDINLSWSRWYRRAIKKSADQVRGAERWIKKHPDRLFLDAACTQPFPLELPPAERLKIHCVVVALGCAEACRKHFEHGSGSLQIVPGIVADEHIDQSSPRYEILSIGDLNPQESFVHIFDDVTLDVVLRELDTIVDFSEYLQKKEDFIRSGKLFRADGEEDILAYYLTHTTEDSEHAFVKRDRAPWGDTELLKVESGSYEKMRNSPQYIAKKKANEISYTWDRLIGEFTKNIIGDSLVTLPDWENISRGARHEEGVRYMALENRTERRMLGQALINAMESIGNQDRFARGLLPGPAARKHDTGYLLLLLRYPDRFDLEGGYDQYRAVRSAMLYGYALNTLRRNPQLKRVIGIATEPPAHLTGRQGGSEDLMYMEMPEWSNERISEAERFRTQYEIFKDETLREYRVQTDEYPDVKSDSNSTYSNPIPYSYSARQPTEQELEAKAQRAKKRAAFKAALLSST